MGYVNLNPVSNKLEIIAYGLTLLRGMLVCNNSTSPSQPRLGRGTTKRDPNNYELCALHSYWNNNPRQEGVTMNGENQPLVIDEPVEVQGFRKTTHHLEKSMQYTSSQ